MRITKRGCAVFLIVVLLCSMASVCSAATVSGTDTFDGCTYAYSTSCHPNSFGAVMEYQYSDTSEQDYLLQLRISYYYPIKDGIFTVHTSSNVYSTAAYGVTGYNKSFDNLEYTYTSFYINTELSEGPIQVYPT